MGFDGGFVKATAPYIDMIAPQHFNREISVNGLADVADLPILMSDDYFGFYYPGEKRQPSRGRDISRRTR